ARAVEGDHRPGEGLLERLPGERLWLPGPGAHRAFGTDCYEVDRGLEGHRVVLERRRVDRPVRGPRTQDAAVRETGHEAAQHRPQRTGVVESDLQRRAQRNSSHASIVERVLVSRLCV